MPFKDDEARRTYFRDYRRRVRSGQPKPEREPDYAAMDNTIGDWIRRGYHPAWADKVLAAMGSLDLHTDDGCRELARVYAEARRADRVERRQRREAKREAEAKRKAERDAEHELWKRSCDWCQKPASADRMIICSGGFHRICVPCAQAVIRYAESGVSEPMSWDEWLRRAAGHRATAKPVQAFAAVRAIT